jgi:hypothetical protein
MDARSLEYEAEELRRKRRRSLESAVLTAVAGGLAPVAWQLEPRLGIAVCVGAALQLVLATWAFFSRRERLEELAIDPAAYIIPDVKEFGMRVAAPRQRELLARGILSLIRDAVRPGNLYLGDRVVRYGRELEAIARDLLSPTVRVQPTAAASCRWLLTHGADSPLYNPRLPAEDLGSWLYRIRAGISEPTHDVA